MFRTVDARTDNPRQAARNTLGTHGVTAPPTSGGSDGQPGLPDPDAPRWRCGGCGNLTRFDVTRSPATTEFWHFDLAGDAAVEDTEVRTRPSSR